MKNKVTFYLLLSFVFSWLCWSIAYLAEGYEFMNYIAPLGSLVGYMFSVIIYDDDTLQKMRIRIHFKATDYSYRLVVYIVMTIFISSYILVSILNDGYIDINPIGLTSAFPFSSTLVVLLIWTIIFGLSEEVGWRGYFFYQLRKLHSFKTSSIYTGILSTIWFSPFIYHFIDISNIEMVTCIAMIIGILFSNILLCFVFEISNGSVMPAVFLHGSSYFILMSNFVDERFLIFGAVIVVIITLYVIKKYELFID